MGLAMKIGRMAACFALLAAACGGDPEAAHRAALEQEIVSDLTFASAENAACIGDKIMLEFTRTQLEERGLSTQNLTSGQADVNELIGNRGADLPAALLSCIDADDRFVAAVSAVGGASLTPGCLDPKTFQTSEQLAVVLYGEKVDPDDDLRDVVRDCMSEEAFATLFGLDQPAELMAALVVDPLNLMEDRTAPWESTAETSACVGAAIVEDFGVEALGAAGVTVQEPTLFRPSVDLDESDETRIQAALTGCDALTPMLIRFMSSDEPETADCAVRSLTDQEESELFLAAYADVQSTGTTQVSSTPYYIASNDCVNTLVTDRFGESNAPIEVRLYARSFVDGFFEDDLGDYPMSRYESKCFVHRSELALTPGLIDGIEAVGAGATAEDFFAENPSFLGDMYELFTCLDADRYTEFVFLSWGFSQSTVDCMYELVGEESRMAYWDVAVEYKSDVDPDRLDAYVNSEDEVAFAVDQCATKAEAEVYYYGFDAEEA